MDVKGKLRRLHKIRSLLDTYHMGEVSQLAQAKIPTGYLLYVMGEGYLQCYF